ncbi:MAG TPA: acyl carrier protein [Candidatus Aminicenantes bacterium]|nr:acyl carrier protein [Candidatus Aminicenantes bacterium]HRY65737.1 acyl carrier protein [Candidatus Aminicenantes bacterium]HRZ72651.1 acyl carrier protein [Candidatus Aminicenantes bacterium]
MEKTGFYEALAEILEVEKVGDADVLREFDAWDSLTKLSIIALADSDYRTVLTAKDLDGIATVGDLKDRLEKNGQ